MKPVVRKGEGSWQIFSTHFFLFYSYSLASGFAAEFQMCAQEDVTLAWKYDLKKKGVGIVSRNNHHVIALLFLKISIRYFDKRREPRSNPSEVYVSNNGICKAFRLINIHFTIWVVRLLSLLSV